MEFSVVTDSWAWTWIVIPLFIFAARIVGDSISTIRLMMVAKGKKYIAPALAFFEVMIWLLIITQIMQNLHNIAAFLAYGFGFAAGTFVGMTLEERIFKRFDMPKKA